MYRFDLAVSRDLERARKNHDAGIVHSTLALVCLVALASGGCGTPPSRLTSSPRPSTAKEVARLADSLYPGRFGVSRLEPTSDHQLIGWAKLL
jgi:hypothetical protein